MLEQTSSTPPPQRHDPVLCFVRLPWAYFSFVPCDDPSIAGDGWDEPYSPKATGNPACSEQVLRVALESHGLRTPDADPMVFSPVTINAARSGWLFATAGSIVARAGMPLSTFREVMRERGADVFEPTWHGRSAFDLSDPVKGIPWIIWPETRTRQVHAQRETAPTEPIEPPTEESKTSASGEQDIFQRDPIAADARNVAQTRHDLTVFYPAVFLKEPLFLQDVLDHPAMSDKKGVVFYYLDKGTHYRIIAERVVPQASPTQVTNLALEQQMVQACGEDGAVEVAARIIAATSRQEGEGSCSES